MIQNKPDVRGKVPIFTLHRTTLIEIIYIETRAHNRHLKTETNVRFFFGDGCADIFSHVLRFTPSPGNADFRTTLCPGNSDPQEILIRRKHPSGIDTAKFARYGDRAVRFWTWIEKPLARVFLKRDHIAKHD